MRTLTDDDTGEKFEFWDGLKANNENIGALKPIKKKFDWSQVADGVFVRNTFTHNGAYLYYEGARTASTELDTENWQYWGPEHPSFPNCPLPDCVEIRVKFIMHLEINVNRGEPREFAWDSEHGVLGFAVIGLADGWEY